MPNFPTGSRFRAGGGIKGKNLESLTAAWAEINMVLMMEKGYVDLVTITRTLSGIALYFFLVTSIAASAFWFFRDYSKKSKMIALVIGEIAIHISFVLALLGLI